MKLCRGAGLVERMAAMMDMEVLATMVMAVLDSGDGDMSDCSSMLKGSEQLKHDLRTKCASSDVKKVHDFMMLYFR